MSAGGKELLTLPPSQWVGIRIECTMGRNADGNYKLEVTLPGAAPQLFYLPLVNAQFRRLEWFGFVSNADAATTIYLDDINLSTQIVAQAFRLIRPTDPVGPLVFR